MKDIHVIGDDRFRLSVAVGNDGADFFVDLACHIFAVAVFMPDIVAQKDILSALFVIDGSDGRRHSVAGHHLAGNICCLLDILGRSGGNVIQNQFLGNAASETDHDLLQHASACVVHLIAVGQWHSVAARAVAGGNDGNCIDVADIRQFVEKNGMTGLVVGGDPFFLLGNNMALLFLTDPDLDESVLDIRLLDKLPVLLGSRDRGLIEQIFKIRTGKTCRGARDLFEIHVVTQGFVCRMDLEDVLPALHIGASDGDLAVKTAGTQDSGVQDIDAVGGRHDDDSLIDTEAVHLDQQLVEGLFAFIVGAAQSRTSAARDCVDLVDEYDTG